MNIKIEPVTMENFKDLPDFRLFPYSCRFCAYWESLDFNEKGKKEDAEHIKREWFIQVGKEFGNCGFIAYVDNAPIGFAQYAPTRFFSTVSKYQAGTPSKDSVFLACLYIAKRELRKKGIGRQLLEKVTHDLENRGFMAIETYACITDNPSSNIGYWYAGPMGFFLKMGFQLRSKKDEIALLRKEIGRKK